MTFLTINPQLLMHMPGGDQWIWIILAVILLFGGKKIPELAKGIGKGMREFTDAKNGIKSEIETGLREKEEAPKA
jgi:sec-independent protein translocase protein TatA